jgi:hypothetical protein
MQDGWISRASSLLAIIQAVQGKVSSDQSLLDRRTVSFSERWPGVLAGLNALETAMLQDLN